MKTIAIISLILLLFYNIQFDNKKKVTVQFDNKKKDNIIYEKEIVINRLNKITNPDIIKDKRPLISKKCKNTKFDPNDCYYWLNCGFSMQILDYDLDFVKDKINNCKKNKK